MKVEIFEMQDFTENVPELKPCIKSRKGFADNKQISLLLHNDTRLVLSQEALEKVPHQILKYAAEKIDNLDLSQDCFKDLSFLQNFPRLQTLILDNNSNLDHSTLPYMDKLQILWLNNCNIANVTDWLITLHDKCPALRHLSLMCNPVGSTVLNGFSEKDEMEYIRQILEILPNLEYFDNIRITDEHRSQPENQEMFPLNVIRVCQKEMGRFMDYTMKILNFNY